MPVTTPRRLLIAAAIGGAILTPGALAQRAGEAAPIAPAATAHLRDNAALLYWRAFALMNDGLEQTIGELAPSAGERVFVADANQRITLAGASDVIDHLLRAAAMEHCDFALDYDNWPYTLLPHMGAMRNGVRLLAIDARLKLDAGDTDGAVDRIAAAIRIAHHSADGHTLLTSLVSIAMFSVADGVLQAALPPDSLTSEQRARIADALAQFPEHDPFRARASVAMEGTLVAASLRRQLADPQSRSELARVFQNGGPMGRTVEALRSGERLDADVDLLAAGFAQTLAAWDSEDSIASLDMVSEQVEAGAFGDLSAGLLPSLAKARQSDLRAQAQLRDAIARYR